MRHLMHDDVFKARHRFFGQFQIQPDELVAMISHPLSQFQFWELASRLVPRANRPPCATGLHDGSRQKPIAPPRAAALHQDVPGCPPWGYADPRSYRASQSCRRRVRGVHGRRIKRGFHLVSFARQVRRRRRPSAHFAAKGMPKSPSMFRQTAWTWLALFCVLLNSTRKVGPWIR